MPVPLRLIAIAPIEQLLANVTAPVAAPATVGSNCRFSVTLFPGFNVIGNEAPGMLNPVPVNAAELIVTAAVPLEVNVTDCVAGVFRLTAPKATLLLLRLSVAVVAFNWSANVFATPPAVAVSVAVCAVLTAAAVAVNAALDDPAATVTDAGTVTALLLLARLTVVAVVAAAVSVTVHASVPAPVSVALPHVTPLSAAGACPVPLRLIVAVPPLEALLAMVTAPLTAPAAAGSNPIVSVAVWPGFSVTGAVTPDPENPVPVTDTPLIVSAAVPEDVSVTDFVIAVFSGSVPNATLVALRFRAAVVAFNWRANVFATPPAVAVSVAVCAVLTAAAAAVNTALDAPAATVTDAGTVTALLLLARPTVVAVVAAAVSVTVHASVPAPVSVALPHVTPLSVAGAVGPLTPVPLRLMTRLYPSDVSSSLVIVSRPVTTPAVVGVKATSSVTACPGFSVTGNFTPATAKPLPLTRALLMVSAKLPVDDRTTGSIAVVFSATFPNANPLCVVVRIWVAASNSSGKL
jgi:hypothetical protein